MRIPEGFLGSVRVSSKGQITIPRRARHRMGVESGARVRLTLEGRRLLVEPSRAPARAPSPGDEIRELLFWISELIGRVGRLLDEIAPEEPVE